jgi:hypothetical protein
MGTNPSLPSGELSATEVHEPKPQKRVAERPHRITILIGIFSPTVGICALIISLFSLRTSVQSLEIGQRAYLSMDSGSFYLSEGPHDMGTLDLEWVVLAGIVHNTGNTPARIKKTLTTYKLSDGWSISKTSLLQRSSDPRAGLPVELAAKSDNKWSYGIMAELLLPLGRFWSNNDRLKRMPQANLVSQCTMLFF